MGIFAGSPTGIVHADVTLTRSKVKVKVTGLLNFQQLAKPCMLAAMTTAPFGTFWFENGGCLLSWIQAVADWLREINSAGHNRRPVFKVCGMTE